MKKTKESIELKRDRKIREVIAKADYDLDRKCAEAERCWQDYATKLINKYIRKRNAYVNKKKIEYERKCNNEIRKLQWKPEREYKVKKKKLNKLEFAMEIAQENARLRDSDSEWRWYCISCDSLKERWEHAWGHYIPRWVKNICLSPININLQCHSCNNLMWPYKTTPRWIATTIRYRENLIKKCSLEAVEQLEAQKVAYFQKWYETNWDYGQWDIYLDDFIDQLILENAERWSRKSFYSPRKNWKKIWEENKS